MEPKQILYQHWYDEPPYESDPEDFLIGKDSPKLTREEDVISLKTAGDISIPRETESSYNARYYYQQPESTDAAQLEEHTYNNISELQAEAAAAVANYVRMDSQTNGMKNEENGTQSSPRQGEKETKEVKTLSSRMSGISIEQNRINTSRQKV